MIQDTLYTGSTCIAVNCIHVDITIHMLMLNSTWQTMNTGPQLCVPFRSRGFFYMQQHKLWFCLQCPRCFEQCQVRYFPFVTDCRDTLELWPSQGTLVCLLRSWKFRIKILKLIDLWKRIDQESIAALSPWLWLLQSECMSLNQTFAFNDRQLHAKRNAPLKFSHSSRWICL